MSKELPLIDEYIRQFPQDIQEILYRVRDSIKRCAPDATEKMSYGMPTFYMNGNLIHFAANKQHLGIYPGGKAVGIFADKLVGYKTSKGAIQFPYNKPIPYALIEDITKYRVLENTK